MLSPRFKHLFVAPSAINSATSAAQTAEGPADTVIAAVV
jgi:hypothetical protein